MAKNNSVHSLRPHSVNLLAPPTKQTFNKLLVLGYAPTDVTSPLKEDISAAQNAPDKTASVFTFNERGEKIRAEKQTSEREEQHSKEIDLAILTDDQARAWEIDAAEHWLIKEASGLYGSSNEGPNIIIGLQEIVERAGQNRFDILPGDRVARHAREAVACLHQIFFNLSATGKNLWDPEVRIRLKLMPAIASMRLHELIQANPSSADAANPASREIRENAQSLLGEIITKTILQKISKEFQSDSSETQDLWNDIILLATDISNEAGLGAIKQLRDWINAGTLTRDEYRASEKVLREIAFALISSGNQLSHPAVRMRLRTIGQPAVDFLQKIIKEDSENSRKINLESPSQRLHASSIINEIGLDVTQEDLRIFSVILKSGTDNQLFTKIFQQIVARASDTNNPLGLSAVSALKTWTEDWKPDTNEYKIGEQALRAVAARLIPNGQALDNTNVRERIKLIGPPAITALKMVVDKNGANVLFCKNQIASIEAAEHTRKRLNKVQP